MALTAKSKAFAQAIIDGMTNREAAIHAGYSEKTASTKGSMLSKDPEIIAYIDSLKNKSASKKEAPKSASDSNIVEVAKIERTEPEHEQVHGQFVGKNEIGIGSLEDPLEYLKSVWTDDNQDKELRLAAARAALPYVHGKVADKGKKETKADAARNNANSGGKFGTLGSQLRS